jgi:hypothetical protein
VAAAATAGRVQCLGGSRPVRKLLEHFA